MSWSSRSRIAGNDGNHPSRVFRQACRWRHVDGHRGFVHLYTYCDLSFEWLTIVVFFQLVEPHEKPLPGQIRDANRATLSTLVSDAGFPVADLGIAADTYVLKSRVHVHVLFMT